MPQPWSLQWGLATLAAAMRTENLPFRIDATVNGTHLGNAASIISTLRSLLSDGSWVVRDRYDNREFPVRIRISGVDGDALAEAEALLYRQCDEEFPPELVWVPPALSSAACVFDVILADMEADTSEGWDMHERMLEHRYFVLTFRTKPHVRPATPVVAAALPRPVDPDTSPAPVIIDACDSTTGWTLASVPGGGTWTNPAGLVASGGALRMNASVTSPGGAVDLTRDGTLTFTAGHDYLFVDAVVAGQTGNPLLEVSIGHTSSPAMVTLWLTAPIVAVGPSPDVVGATRFYMEHTTFMDTADHLKLRWRFANGTQTASAILAVSAVGTAAQVVSFGATDRQQNRTVDVVGAAPTTATIRLYQQQALPGEGMSLAHLLAYTCRGVDVFPPPLRSRLVTGGDTTADPSAWSGATTDFDVPSVFDLPAATLEPGAYALYMRVVGGGGDLTWTVESSIQIGDPQTATVHVPAPTGSINAVVELGVLDLPGTSSTRADAIDTLTISMTNKVGTPEWDELYLFNVDTGTVTHLALWLTDVASVEVRSPDIAQLPDIRVRQADDPGWVTVSAAARSLESHEFRPGQMTLFYASDAIFFDSELEFFPRYPWHVWAAELAATED